MLVAGGISKLISCAVSQFQLNFQFAFVGGNVKFITIILDIGFLQDKSVYEKILSFKIMIKANDFTV